MMIVAGDWPGDELVVVRVTSRLYRVLRAEYEPAESPLLGFVQLLGDVYEAVSVSEPLHRSYWATLDSAVTALAVCETKLGNTRTQPSPASVVELVA
jgi:hypothetical protein